MINLLFVDILFLTTCYLLGSGFTASNNKKFRSTFLRLLTGALALITSYAIIRSGFNTVLILLPILLSALFLTGALRIKVPRKFRFGTEGLIITILIFLVTYLSLLPLFSSLYGIVLPLHEDQQYYAKVAYFLFETGTESTSLDPASSPVPYHYVDLWLAAFLIELSSMQASLCLIGGAYPILFTILFIGFCAIVENYFTSSLYIVGISITFLFITGIYLSFYQNVPGIRFSQDLAYIPITFPKLFIAYILLSAFVLHFLERSKRAAAYLFMLPVVYISFLPALTGLFVAFVLTWFFFRKKIPERQRWPFNKIAFSTGLISILGLLLFYSLNTTSGSAIASGISSTNGESVLNGDNFGLAFRITAGSIFSLIILFIPVYLLLAMPSFASLKKLFTPLNLIFFVLTLMGLTAWALLNNVSNAVQLFTNLLGPVFTLSLLNWFALKSAKPTPIIMLIPFALCCYGGVKVAHSYHTNYLNVVDKHDPAFLANLAEILSYTGPKGAFLRSYEDYESHFNYSIAYATLDLQFQTLNLPSGVHTLGINYLNEPLDRNRHYFQSEMKMVESSEFYKFRQHNHGNDTCESQKEFIEHLHLRYLLTSKQVKVPTCLRVIFPDSIVDPKSGLKFFYQSRLRLDPE